MAPSRSESSAGFQNLSAHMASSLCSMNCEPGGTRQHQPAAASVLHRHASVLCAVDACGSRCALGAAQVQASFGGQHGCEPFFGGQHRFISTGVNAQLTQNEVRNTQAEAEETPPAHDASISACWFSVLSGSILASKFLMCWCSNIRGSSTRTARWEGV